MSSNTWALIKSHKNFHVHIYRRGLAILLCSAALNCILGVALFYVYISEPEPDYYATSGITPPVALNALLEPNWSAQALLEPDPPDSDDNLRAIPQ